MQFLNLQFIPQGVPRPQMSRRRRETVRRRHGTVSGTAGCMPFILNRDTSVDRPGSAGRSVSSGRVIAVAEAGLSMLGVVCTSAAENINRSKTTL